MSQVSQAALIAATPELKKVIPLDERLDGVSYDWLNSGEYVPSEFALLFANFIKLVNGSEAEENKTPPFHLAMLDRMSNDQSEMILNLVFRGGAKTTLWAEYLFPFVACFGKLPGLSNITGAMYVSDSMDNGVASLRKNLETRYERSEFLQQQLPRVKFTENAITFWHKSGRKFGLRMYGAEQGIRGTKIFGKRPTLCVLDDLMSDSAAASKATLQRIKDTIYKGVMFALHPSKRKVIFNGTPFNSEDPIVQAAQSAAWKVNVWPVCEKFPCEPEEFRGAWEDRFDYWTLKRQYDDAVSNGVAGGFMQELMLRITSAEERLVQDGEINWYKRQGLLRQKEHFNYYITTDFATSTKQTADHSVISVWAYNHKGFWFWVDGIAERRTMDKNIDDLFRFVIQYKPQGVGVERSGQQGGFISWIQREMLSRNVWFNLLSNDKGNTPGILPISDKLSRFNLVVPWFKAGMFWFPDEMRDSPIMKLAMGQIRLVTGQGIKGKDDFIDTISMLGQIVPWRPAEPEPDKMDRSGIWGRAGPQEELSGLASYVV